MGWSGAFELVEPYVVKIATPAGTGTGFLFAYNADKSMVGIATALHVVDEANQWRQPVKVIHVKSGKELFLDRGERAILVDYQRDSAAILVGTAAITAAGLPVPDSMLPMLPSDKVKKIGVSLAWAGYPAIAPNTLCLFQGGVSAFNDKDDSYYIDGVAINGVSGGPVFDNVGDKVQIVGIVSAYHYNRQTGGNLPGLLMAHDATHLNQIVEGLRTLDEAKAKAQQDALKESEKEASTTVGPLEPGTSRQDSGQATPGPDEPRSHKKRRGKPPVATTA